MNIFKAFKTIIEHKDVIIRLGETIIDFTKAPTDPEIEIDRDNFFKQKDIAEIVAQTFADWSDRDEPLGYATENWDAPTEIGQTTNPDRLPYDPREGF